MIVLIILIFILENDEKLMSKLIVKQIPVSNHVYKYLQYLHGSSYKYSRKDFLGNIIFGVMRRGYRLSYMYKLDKTYPIKLTKDDIERMGKIIEWDQCIDFNKAIDSVFRCHLHFHLDMQRKLNEKAVYQSMVQSLLEMNITDNDISYETLYRDYKRKLRYKKTTKKNIDFFPKNSSEELSSNFGRTVQ